jgi:signal transduction histidine kinase/DNA-binding response OmpR family regulator/HPt (histidine-containing phosphotransfer) domain-containing protein
VRLFTSTRRPSGAWGALGALALAGVVALTSLHGWLSREAGDVLTRLAAPERHFENMLIVDIDEASLRDLAPLVGGWPLKRDLHAKVLNYLRESGAAAVAIDVVYADPREGDDKLVEALHGRMPVVLGATGVRQRLDSAAETLAAPRVAELKSGVPSFSWPAIVLPHAGLTAGEGRLPLVGMASTPLDVDGQLRAVQVLHRSGRHLLPSMPVATVQALTGDHQLRYDPVDGSFVTARRTWPADAAGRVSVRAPRNRDAVPVLPFSRLARAALGAESGDALRQHIAGRTVVLGSSAFPGESVMTPHGQLSNVQWIAISTGALLTGDVLRPAGAPAVVPIWLIALAPLIVFWRRPTASALLCTSLSTACALAVVLSALVARIVWGQVIDPVLPVLAIAGGLATMLGLRQIALTRANRQAEIDRAVADASNRAKSEFLAHVSHEIRTPMNAVLGVADLLSETELSPVQRRHVEVFRRSGEALACLIDDLLDLSKIEAGRVELVRAEFSLHNLLREQVALLRPRADSKGVHLGLKLSPSVPDVVMGDRLRLTQVIVNLLANAIKFTPRGTVSIDVERDERAPGLVRFAVIDTGVGIDAAKIDRIFEPFMQADHQTVREFGGTGLGLTITRRIVELMGGQIQVTSTPGRGSEFAFAVPLPAAASATAPRPPASATTAPAPLSRRLDILLADDNPTSIYILKAMLDQPQLNVDVVGTGREALEHLEARRYDLVLIDIQMPEMDGLTATRTWRRIETARGLPRTPIVVLSANAFESDRQRSAEAGCDEHIAKPVRKAVLMKAIARWTTRPEDSVSPASGNAGTMASELPDWQRDALATLSRDGTIDAAHALAHLGGDVPLLLDTLQQLAQPMGDWSARFRATLAAGDAERSRRMVHDLKGILDGIGALAAMKEAACIEEVLRGGQTVLAEPLLDDLEARMQPVVRAMRRAVDRAAQGRTASRPDSLPPSAH